jgi:hypothetical protein
MHMWITEIGVCLWPGQRIWCTLILESEMTDSEMIWASTLTWTPP